MGKSLFGVVDGDHRSEGCKKDLLALSELGAEFIFADDTSWLPELQQVSKEFALSNGYQFMNLGYMNGVGLLVKE